MWWQTPIIPAFEGLRQTDCLELEASLGSVVRSRAAPERGGGWEEGRGEEETGEEEEEGGEELCIACSRSPVPFPKA